MDYTTHYMCNRLGQRPTFVLVIELVIKEISSQDSQFLVLSVYWVSAGGVAEFPDGMTTGAFLVTTVL